MTYEICAFDDRKPPRRGMRWLAAASVAGLALAAVPAAATGYNETSGDLSNSALRHLFRWLVLAVVCCGHTTHCHLPNQYVF